MHSLCYFDIFSKLLRLDFLFDFLLLEHKLIYRAIRRLRDHGNEIDTVTLIESLTSDPDISSITNFNQNEYIRQLAKDTPGTANFENYTDIVKQIKELLDTRVRPAVAMDGGDIVYDSFKDGVVYLHMQGACSGCPSSTATLKMGIENMLKHYVPEVQEVRPIDA